MNTAALRPGDIIDCNVKGRTFTAEVVSANAGLVQIKPPRGITYYQVRARDVTKRHRPPRARSWRAEDSQIREDPT